MADLDIAAMNASQKLAFAKAAGSIVLDGYDISAPVDNFIFELPAGYDDFLLSARNVSITGGGLVTFAFGDEGVEGEFYKDDETFLGYQIILDAVRVTTPDADPVLSAGAYEDGYGQLLSLFGGDGAVGKFEATIDPGSGSSYAMCHSEGMAYKAPLNQTLVRKGNVFTTEQVRMNALRICVPVGEGRAIVSGSFTLVGRARP